MIKCEKGCVEIEGRRSEILAEFSCLVKGIYETFSEEDGKEMARYLFDRSYRDGFAKDKEIISDLSEAVKGILEELFNIKEKKDGE